MCPKYETCCQNRYPEYHNSLEIMFHCTGPLKGQFPCMSKDIVEFWILNATAFHLNLVDTPPGCTNTTRSRSTSAVAPPKPSGQNKKMADSYGRFDSTCSATLISGFDGVEPLSVDRSCAPCYMFTVTERVNQLSRYKVVKTSDFRPVVPAGCHVAFVINFSACKTNSLPIQCRAPLV